MKIKQIKAMMLAMNLCIVLKSTCCGTLFMPHIYNFNSILLAYVGLKSNVTVKPHG
jgi:uncharacterized membrane protein